MLHPVLGVPVSSPEGNRLPGISARLPCEIRTRATCSVFSSVGSVLTCLLLVAIVGFESLPGGLRFQLVLLFFFPSAHNHLERGSAFKSDNTASFSAKLMSERGAPLPGRQVMKKVLLCGHPPTP